MHIMDNILLLLNYCPLLIQNQHHFLSNQNQHNLKRSILLCVILIGMLACNSPTEYDVNEPIAKYDRYIVGGYVNQNNHPLVNKSVWMYIKDYQYTAQETTFECKTNFQGYYRFTVTNDNDEWNNCYYNITCGLQRFSGKIIFGKTDRIDFNL